MVTGGGLCESSDIWAPCVYYDRDLLMTAWQRAVIALLRAALRAAQLRTELTAGQMGDLLTHLERCWWSIKIQLFEDKWHVLQYAGRYVRQPPVAAAPYHLDRATNCQVLVQRQKAASPGGGLLTQGVCRSLDPAHTGALSTRGSELWAVWSSRRRAEFSSYLCSSRAEPKATPQAPRWADRRVSTTLRPVSYTHLDVYKRQSLQGGSALMRAHRHSLVEHTR